MITTLPSTLPGFPAIVSHGTPHASPAPHAEEGATLESLTRLCEAAGWEPKERSGGRIVVPLEVAHAFQQAVVSVEGAGWMARAELAALEPLCMDSRLAIETVLSRVAALVHGVRPFFTTGAGSRPAGLEFVSQGPPAGAGVADALDALSVACNLCAAEVQSLCDGTIARTALETWEIPQNNNQPEGQTP